MTCKKVSLRKEKQKFAPANSDEIAAETKLGKIEVSHYVAAYLCCVVKYP